MAAQCTKFAAGRKRCGACGGAGGGAEAMALAEMTDHVFYDGDCGFCHKSVRFLAARDRAGRFRFAPLGGETFLALVPEGERAGLPDSLVVRTPEGHILVQSEGMLHCLRRLGGGFRALARLLALVPRPLRDASYAAFARNRQRWFARPREACPVPSGALRARFDP